MYAGDAMQSCYLCMGTCQIDKLIYLFGVEGKKEQLYEKIHNYTPFKLMQCDKTSAVICIICMTNINNWDKYVQYCVRAQQNLKNQQKIKTTIKINTNIPNEKLSLESEVQEPSHRTSQQVTDTSHTRVASPQATNTFTCSRSARLRSIYCIAKWCNNNNGKSAQVSMFRIPKNQKRAHEWLSKAGREDLLGEDLTVLHSKYLCQEHFTSNMFMNSNHNKLVWNALPSLFSTEVLAKKSSLALVDNNSVTAVEVTNPKRKLLLKPKIGSSARVVYIEKHQKNHRRSESAKNSSLTGVSTNMKHPSGSVTCSKMPEKLSPMTKPESDSLMTEADHLFINSEVDGLGTESLEAMFTCTYCGEVFLVKSNLIAHQMTYHPGHSVGCELCGKAGYQSKSEFMEHICEHHNATVQ